MIQIVKKKTHKQAALTLISMLLLAALFALTGCSSAKNPEPKEDANASTEGVAETEVEEAEAETTETTAETVAEETAESEPTAEPTPEPVVYEGIDMESTLPTAEWVLTFDGIIDEPKMVIFNDTTNKKIIVEQGQEAEIAQGDSLGIYIPKANTVVVKKSDNDNFWIEDASSKRIYILSEISPELDIGDTFVTTNVLEYDGVEATLTATLTLTKG